MVKVLIVDDEVDFCTFLGQSLSKDGYSVLIANSGIEAIEKVKAEKPHLVLLDIRMPEMDGIRTLKRIKEIDQNIVVMMITVVSDTDIAQSAIKLGAVNYIIKPLDVDMLKRSLHAWAMQIEAKQLSGVDILALEYNKESFKIAFDFFIKKEYNVKYVENPDSEIETAKGSPTLLILRADLLGAATIPLLEKYRDMHPGVPKVITINPSDKELLSKIREFGNCRHLEESFDACDLILMLRCLIVASEERRKVAKARELSRYVFVVDDDPDICEWTARFLDKEGYKVRAITDARKVLAETEALKPSLVLLDIVMPNADGLELLRKIKKISPQTQVIMISGLKNETICRESMESGASSYLVKPFSLDQLKATIITNNIKAH